MMISIKYSLIKSLINVEFKSIAKIKNDLSLQNRIEFLFVVHTSHLSDLFTEHVN